MSERSAVDRKSGCRAQALSALALVLAAIPVLVWILIRVAGEDWWVGAALVYAPNIQWIAVPLVGVVVALIVRNGGLVALNVAAAAFAVFAVADFQVNTSRPLPEDRPVVRVATWNVYGWTEERDLVQERIMSWDCDIVCLQEAARSIFRDLLPGYESASAADLRIYVRGRILSRDSPRDPITHKRRMMVCEVETEDGARITVATVHIPRAEERGGVPREAEPLIDYIRGGVDLRGRMFAQLLGMLPDSGPVIVAGDMNTPPASQYYRQTAARLTDSFAAVGRGFGHTFVWRRKLPMLRIDYVWVGGGIEPLRIDLKDPHPSDHRPVVTDLAPPLQDGAEHIRPE